jgi:hypothetical protein
MGNATAQNFTCEKGGEKGTKAEIDQLIIVKGARRRKEGIWSCYWSSGLLLFSFDFNGFFFGSLY